MKLLEKKFLLGKISSIVSCLLVKSKISFLQIILVNKVFQEFLVLLVGLCQSSDMFRDTGRVCSKVVLFFSIGTSSVSVKLSIWSR